METWKEIMTNGPLATYSETGCGETLEDMKLRSINALSRPANGYDCPLCRNKGVVFSYEGPEKRLLARDCKCVPMRRAIRKMRESGLGDTLDRFTFRNFQADEPWQQALLHCAESYAEAPKGWLVLLGQPGCGKTHLCTAVCGELLRRGEELLYFSWRLESARIKSALPEAREELLRQYLNAPYLYIDDLFKTGRGPDGTVAPSAADLNLAFTLLSARYARQAPTILSSELSADALLRLDEAIGSRIVEMAGKNLCAVRNDKKRNYRLKGIREL